ncbi:hypothetical protein TNCV_2760621 [Trichonephila clavipes]|nr:hypothetical protein TNCV_2760621 [Trichonephila clavipes]
MKEGSFWVPSIPNAIASTLPITPKRSSSRDVGTSSYRYHTATYSPASVSANSYTRAFDDGPRNFEAWSSEWMTPELALPSPTFTPTGGRFSSGQI